MDPNCGSDVSASEIVFKIVVPKLWIHCLAVQKTILNFVIGHPPPGHPGGGSVLPFSEGSQRCWADSGPDPGGSIFVICMLALSAAGIVGSSLFGFVIITLSKPYRTLIKTLLKPYYNPIKTVLKPY